MDVQNFKRIKVKHQTTPSLENVLNEIHKLNHKLNHINTKLETVDNKINQIGNMSMRIVSDVCEISSMKNNINKIIEHNENHKNILLQEIGELQTTIIQKLSVNKPISNNMLSAYS